MSLHVKTATPRSLLKEIKSKIGEGRIDTWIVDSDGDFTHLPDQWQYHAWMRPFIVDDGIVFGIIAPKDIKISVTDYAVYHGRFAEMLLAHFDSMFSEVKASSMATKYDNL